MDRDIAALAYRLAPRRISSRWHQVGLKRTLDEWKRKHPKGVRDIRTSEGFAMVVGIDISPDGVGQNGQLQGYQFAPDIEEHLLDEIEHGDLAEEFAEDWIACIHEVIEEEQEQTTLSPKQYAAYLGYRHPEWTESQTADALDITVGTFRGKIGRVRKKIDEARATTSLADELPDEEERADGSDWRCGVSLSVVDRLPEDRLPVRSATNISQEGLSIDDVPVEQLIYDEDF